MEIPFNSDSPTPSDNARAPKRPRSETPGLSGLHASGRTSALGTEAEIKRLKRQIAELREQVTQSEDHVREKDAYHTEIRKKVEEMAEKEQNRFRARLRESDERIKELEKEVEEKDAELDELRKALEDADDELKANDSQIQALMAENEKLKRKAIDSNIEQPSTSSGFEEDSTDYLEDDFTSQMEPSTPNIRISQIRSMTSALDSQLPSSEFEKEDQEIQSYVKPKEEIVDNENEDPGIPLRRSNRETSQKNATSGVNPDVNETGTAQVNNTGVTTENLRSRKKWMVQLPGETPELSSGAYEAQATEEGTSGANNPGFIKTGPEVAGSDVRNPNRDSPVVGPSHQGPSTQPGHQEASSSRVPDTGSASDPNLQLEAGPSLPPQYNELILVPAGKYCCLVSEPFRYLNWQKFYSRRGRDKPSYEKMYGCKKCRRVEDVATRVQDHVWVDHENKLFFCPLCFTGDSCGLKTRALLSSHAKKNHADLCEPEAFIEAAERKCRMKLQKLSDSKPNNWRRRR